MSVAAHLFETFQDFLGLGKDETSPLRNGTQQEMFEHNSPSAQHINFGCSHPPRKIIPKWPFGILRLSFPEFPELSGISLEKGLLGDPRNALSGDDEVDMLGGDEA